MADGHDDSSAQRSGHDGATDRQWRHPSEVGMAERGRVDRRRSTYVAAGVLLGGLGVLIGGVFMGYAAWPDQEPAAVAHRWDRTEAAVAEVTIVREDGVTHSSTGVILDEDGHLVVDAGQVADAVEVWARCIDGDDERVDVVGAEAGLAVLRLGTPRGRPAVFANVAPTSDTGIELVRSSSGSLQRAPGSLAPTYATLAAVTITVRPALDHFDIALDGPVDQNMRESAVFDHGGRLVGLTSSDADANPSGSSVTVMSAASVMDVADRIIERAER